MRTLNDTEVCAAGVVMLCTAWLVSVVALSWKVKDMNETAIELGCAAYNQKTGDLEWQER